MDSLLRDLGQTVRSLASKPTHAVAAILCTALGIGLSTTVFSVYYAMILRPFPFADADGILAIVGHHNQRGITNDDLAYADLEKLKEQGSSFAEVAGYAVQSLTLSGDAEAQRLEGAAVSAGLFPLLGAQPALGRNFLGEEDLPGAAGAAILSHGLWQRTFAGDPAILGKSLQIDGQPHQIVGVMPEGFQFPTRQQIWIPLAPRFDDRPRPTHEVSILARLAPSSSLARAQEETTAIHQRVAAERPESEAGWRWEAMPMRRVFVSPGMATMSLTLLGAAIFVLLIACANVANLLLARADARSRELSIRMALGASRRQILGHFLTESLALAVAGGLLGLLFSYAGIRALVLLFPAANPVPYWMEFSLDLPVLFFTTLITLGTCLILGLAPALQAARFNLLDLLNGSGRGNSSGRSRLRSALVVAEVALSVSLLVGGALFLRSFFELKKVDSGLDESRILSLRLHLSGQAFADPEQRLLRMQEIRRRLATLPGVEAVATSNLVPMAGGGATATLLLAGEGSAEADKKRVFWAAASPELFDALGVPMVAGRAFTSAEGWQKTPLAIVNRRFGERYFSGRDPVGQKIRLEGLGGAEEWLTIAGVADDFKTGALDGPVPAAVFVPYPYLAPRNAAILLRTREAPAQLISAVRAQIREYDPGIPVFDVATLEKVRQGSIWQFELVARLFSAFGLLALFLAATGLYGVLSFNVTQRWKEMGIRIALGARRDAVIGLVMRDGLLLSAKGVAIGLLGAFFLSRLLASFLYGISPADPLSFGGLAIFLTLVSAIAIYFPARRATEADPVEILREN